MSTANVPEGMWEKCPGCTDIIFNEDLVNNYKVCPSCGYHFRLSAVERINLHIDLDTFVEMNEDVLGVDPLHFPDYPAKLDKQKEKAGISEAVITGTGNIYGVKVVLAVMDGNFLMGSMGYAVGERITRAVEYATENKLPVIIFTVSGGARMQEGIVSLMQMAKVSSALQKHNQAGLLYITVITNPTTGGVTASFAMLGDIILSEPGALVGFAGKRVIEQTIKQSLPEGFQTSEFLLDKGFIDRIVDRKDLRMTLYEILRLHQGRREG